MPELNLARDELAERLCLSGVLYGGAPEIDRVREHVAPRDWSVDAHRLIWEAACFLADNGEPVDHLSVRRRLEQSGDLSAAGGVEGINALRAIDAALSNLDEHARTIGQLARVRRFQETATALAAAAGGDLGGDPDRWLQSAESRIFEATEQAKVGKCELLSEAVGQVYAQANSPDADSGLSTGWAMLDAKTGGWAPLMYVIAGRPGMGKSAFAYQAAANVASRGLAAMIVSAEMPTDQLARRHLAYESKVGFRDLTERRVADSQQPALAAALDRMSRLPMALEYCPGATIGQVRSSVRRQLARIRKAYGAGTKPGLIVVDYLQILDGERQRGDNRENEIAGLSRKLMRMAGEFGCTVLMLSQLSRDCEKRNDKRPQLSDLRESGAIEQDAYGVLFVYRQGYYDKLSGNEHAPDNEAEIIVAKNRNGPTGTARLAFEARFARFMTAQSEDGIDDR